MAHRTVWVDDLDPTKEAVETVIFGVDGVTYEIDVCAENAERVRNAIEPFASAGRRRNGEGAHPRSAPVIAKRAQDAATRKREKQDAIRAWAKKQGFAVADRGRIPISVQQAFESAHDRKS
ncbi:hypothetical protein BST11_25475 [Mycobacterium alsense]|uniref:Lsr2 family protein n=1 Tax=Mycobacterium alsense TaxID=324058 RepID=A0AA41XT31_9MYCO|nr:Lsr2 family protein [Mycobacterium alsense]MCV7381575.1 Lsr2 family protein [Mycobacterium alsense]OQZ87916.1 hypothetical protein BST11_25475 [Mycobacterium alsense]